MKIRVLPFLFVFLFTVTGCGSRKGLVKPVFVGYEAKININCDTFNGSAQIQVTQQGTVKLTMTEPETLEGLVIVSDASGITVEYNGIKVNGLIPDNNSFESVICEIIAGEPLNSEKAIASGELYKSTGMTSVGEYEVYYRADGLPVKFICNTIGMTAELSEIKYCCE